MKYPHITSVMQPTVDRVRGRQWIIGKTMHTNDNGKTRWIKTDPTRPATRHVQNTARQVDDER